MMKDRDQFMGTQPDALTRLRLIDSLRAKNPHASPDTFVAIFNYRADGTSANPTPDLPDPSQPQHSVIIGFNRVNGNLVSGDVTVVKDGNILPSVLIKRDSQLVVKEKTEERQPAPDELAALNFGLSLVEADLRRQNPPLN